MKKESSSIDAFFGKKNDGKKIVKSLNRENNQKMSSDTNIELDEVVGFEDKNNNVDDLTLINGIGPVIVAVLKKNKIITFAQLASVDVGKLEKLVSDIRGNHNPGAWIAQARKMADKIKKTKEQTSVTKVSKKNIKQGHLVNKKSNEVAVKRLAKERDMAP